MNKPAAMAIEPAKSTPGNPLAAIPTKNDMKLALMNAKLNIIREEREAKREEREAKREEEEIKKRMMEREVEKQRKMKSENDQAMDDEESQKVIDKNIELERVRREDTKAHVAQSTGRGDKPMIYKRFFDEIEEKSIVDDVDGNNWIEAAAVLSKIDLPSVLAFKFGDAKVNSQDRIVAHLKANGVISKFAKSGHSTIIPLGERFKALEYLRAHRYKQAAKKRGKKSHIEVREVDEHVESKEAKEAKAHLVCSMSQSKSKNESKKKNAET